MSRGSLPLAVLCVNHDGRMTQERPKGRVAAAVVGTLAPGDGGKAFSPADRAKAMVPHDWQMLGAQYEWAEIHGVTKGLPHGYFADLLGRAAAAGEQLGIAFAALRDAEVWRDTSVEPATSTHRNIAGRAMAEVCGLWAVSAGHAAANVVARIVRLHSGASSLDKKLKWAGFQAPFDSGRAANLSLNVETMKFIKAAAVATGESPLVQLVEPLHALTEDSVWAAMTARRDAGYHRLRPQSIEGGVPGVSPWTADQTAGQFTLSVSTFSDYVPPALEDVVSETQEGYDALSSAMRVVHDRLPLAISAAGVSLWRT